MKLTGYEQKLVNQLRRGDRKSIAEKLGFHVNTVSKVLRGVFNNDAIWEEVITRVKEYQKLEYKKNKTAHAAIA